MRIFKHWKGNHYILLHEGVYDTTGQPVVIYQSIADGKVFVREHKDFFGMMVDNGEEKRAFEELK